jgi:hypothetical protein
MIAELFRERNMNQLLRFALIAIAAGFSVIAAQAMPFSRNETHDSLVIGVAGGCGPGFHRGQYGGCRRNGYYGGTYYGGGYYGGAPTVPGAAVVPSVAVVPPVVVAPACRRVCNPYRCWRVCN